MLVLKNGSVYASVPVRLVLHSKDAGFVVIGNEGARVLVRGEEIRELFELLRPFVGKETNDIDVA
ncbi:MAG TPA: hypothetical protein VNO43_14025 [Candidatus Eisenbacteria bacterium]|nr:hypothetical protein [Candidatus Eisenbacteria bacterium]